MTQNHVGSIVFFPPGFNDVGLDLIIIFGARIRRYQKKIRERGIQPFGIFHGLKYGFPGVIGITKGVIGENRHPVRFAVFDHLLLLVLRDNPPLEPFHFFLIDGFHPDSDMPQSGFAKKIHKRKCKTVNARLAAPENIEFFLDQTLGKTRRAFLIDTENRIAEKNALHSEILLEITDFFNHALDVTHARVRNRGLIRAIITAERASAAGEHRKKRFAFDGRKTKFRSFKNVPFRERHIVERRDALAHDFALCIQPACHPHGGLFRFPQDDKIRDFEVRVRHKGGKGAVKSKAELMVFF